MEQSKHNLVKFTGGFWQHFEEVNRLNTIPQNYKQSTETGRIEAMKLQWREGMPNKPHYFWDSDVAKWMEAVAFSLMKNPDSQLESQVEIAVRIPGWSHDASVMVNGSKIEIEPLLKDGYVYIKRRWNTGDNINLDLPMPVEVIHANPKVRHDCGRVALTRGPLVYCMNSKTTART